MARMIDSPYDRDVSVLKLVDLSKTDERRPDILALNEDKTFWVRFRVTPGLLRILGGKKEIFTRAKFVGSVLVFGDRVNSWEPELEPFR